MTHGGKGSKEEACIHLLEPLQPRITGPGAAGIVTWLSTWSSRGLKASGRPVFYSQLYFLASHALCLSIPQLPRLLSGRTVHFNVQQALTMRDLPGTAPGPQKALHEASSCHCSRCTGLLSACELVWRVPSIREQCPWSHGLSGAQVRWLVLHYAKQFSNPDHLAISCTCHCSIKAGGQV